MPERPFETIHIYERMTDMGLVDLIYPERCPVCGEIRRFGTFGCCDDCRRELPFVTEPVCLACGKMIESAEEEYCGDCARNPKSFERCFPAFCYEGRIKDSLYAFKYKNARRNVSFYGESIMECYGDVLSGIPFDGVVPVPVHTRKRRSRGYNQAGLLADDLGGRLHVPVFQDYLVRTVDTNPQKELNDQERMKNLKNAFNIGENEVKLDIVLLVDDIYTSGATMEACTRVLLESGVFKVYCACVAIGMGYSD